MRRRCKIVATLGPATDAPGQLVRIIEAGVDVARVNFSHGAEAEHRARIAAVRAAEERTGRAVAILADLQGPKFRLGDLGEKGLALKYGDELRLVAAKTTSEPGTAPLPHPELLGVLKEGDQILFDDGRLIAEISAVKGDERVMRMITPGVLLSRKGVSLPGRAIPVPALTDKDRADLAIALDAGADYIALSFVQRPEDVEEAQALIAGRAHLVAKIEKPSALDSIEAITRAADAVMVARGDLGVELPFEQVPIAQRRIIKTARRLGKPVIVATQMLQSMVEESTPTRAEATDVAAAVYQGADAVMLSAETAVGRHPLTAVAVMDRVVRAIETDLDAHPSQATTQVLPDFADDEEAAFATAIAALTREAHCEAVVAFTESGATALAVARARPSCTVVAVTPNPSSARRLALIWGADPAIRPGVTSIEAMIACAKEAAAAKGARPGSLCALAAGLPIGQPGGSNLIHMFRVGG